MKITSSTLKKLGFIIQPFSSEYNIFINKPTFYPFNQLKLLYNKKTKTVLLQTNNTKYKCNDLKSLLSSIYFAGINYGQEQAREMSQKIKQSQKILKLSSGVQSATISHGGGPIAFVSWRISKIRWTDPKKNDNITSKRRQK